MTINGYQLILKRTMSLEIKKIQKIIKIANEVSPTFCLAKWYHSTIYIHVGETHSCYHPAPHTVPLSELKDNPGALHNTLHKKKERAEMLIGEKPKGCQYCWNIEEMGQDHVSDRMIRNRSIYTPERFNEVVNNPWNSNVNPDYIEIAFSNECNFKCGYCHPMASTPYYSEIKVHGPYPGVKNHGFGIDDLKFFDEDNNPYLDAWWQWWPEVSKSLNILRITGGEPLMHRSTWRLFNELKQEPKPHLELNLNSNLGVKTAMVEKLADNVNELLTDGKIRKFKLFSSMDTWGRRAEYLRTGLDVKLWEHNLDMYVRKTHSVVAIMCTFNVLSVTSFTDFLEKILEWRKTYNDVVDLKDLDLTDFRKIRFDTPYLKEPLQYDMHILPKEEFLPYFDKILKFIDDNRDEKDITKFNDIEYERFRRVRDYFATVEYPEEKIKEGRIDFYRWFTEYDRRREVNFVETFPEMSNFWNMCKQLSEEN
jgi:organic radical activating enzyme